MKEERHVIWSNYGLDYEDWRDDLEAVSYTHLDVYKRQVFEITALEDVYTLDGTLRYSAGEVVDTITTGEDGTAQSLSLIHISLYLFPGPRRPAARAARVSGSAGP